MMKHDNEDFENSVLFVDDEIEVLQLLNQSLMDEDYKKFFAQSVEESMEIIEKYPIDVLVTDIIIPGTNGLELMKMIQDKHPKIIRIIISAHIQSKLVIATINKLNVFKYIPKPWDADNDLKPAIREAINLYNYGKNKEKFNDSLATYSLRVVDKHATKGYIN